MELLLLAILITLLGAWPFIGVSALILAGLFAIYLVIRWIVKNWNNNVFEEDDAALTEVPSWFGGDEQSWVEFQAWYLSWFYDEQQWKIQKKIPSWFGGDKQQWNEFQKWNQDHIRHMSYVDSRKQKDNSILDKIPSWFGGGEQDWSEFLIWSRKMIINHSNDEDNSNRNESSRQIL